MSELRFKACPKCHGDVFLDKDIFQGWIEQCIQCGHVSYPDTIVETSNTAANSVKKTKPRKQTI